MFPPLPAPASLPRLFSGALLACAALTAAARAEPAKDATLAIASVESRGGASADQAATLSDLFTATLVNDGKIRVVERSQIAKIMKEQALAQSGMMSDDAQIQIGKLAGARWMVVATVANEGRGLLLSVRAIDSTSAQIAFADSLKLGSSDQLSAGARQLARKLQDKLVGSSTAAAGGEAVGDFDPTLVKEASRQLARLLAVRFPKVEGRLREVVPNGTSSCKFPDWRAEFQNQHFTVAGIDSVTGQELEKGIFLLKVISDKGCSGRIKSSGADEISDNDIIRSQPLKVAMDPLRVGPGTDPAMGKLFSDETAESLKNQAAFVLSPGDAQVQLIGSISGAKGHRIIEVQALEKGGAVLQRWDLTGTF
jgi:hypothetical protein